MMDLKTDSLTGDHITNSQQINIQMVNTETGSATGHHESISVDESNFSANDLEALANIQEELDRLTAEQSETQEVTHAMITEDGITVPLTINPETGQYMTHDGQHIVVGNHDDHSLMPDTSDLSSLAAAAETHEGMGITMDDSSVEVDESVLTTHQFVQQPQQIILGDSQSAASTIQVKADVMKTEPQMRKIGQPQIKFVSKEGSGAIRIAPSNIQGGAGVLRILNSDGSLSSISPLQNQTIRVLNSDGTLTSLTDAVGSNIRFVTADGSMIQLNQPQEVQAQQVQPQQVRIMNPDGTVTIGSPLTIRPAVTPTIQPQQIRIMNSDDQQQIRVISTSGNDSSLSPGSFRIITSGQQQFDGGTRGKLMTSSNVGMKSPVKAITLSQAQQMGILSGGSSQGTFKILPKSPISIRSPQKLQVGSTIRTADGKTIIIGSPQKQQQIIIRPSKENTTQQIIRIPASKVMSGVTESAIQSASKVQYVRVITSQAPSTSPKTQVVTVKTPFMSTGIKPGTTIPVSVKQNSNVVKIAIPSGQQTIRTSGMSVAATAGSVKTQRIILPSPATSYSQNSSLVQTKVITLSDAKPTTSLPEIQPKPVDKNDRDDDDVAMYTDDKKSVVFRNVVTNSHAYEAFLSKKEDKPKTTSASSASNAASFEPAGVRPRKPCNCTKSQCLKLYCDCFANGEFCFNCNCTNCYNNLHHERQRQKSIKQCLDRNPSAFRPKIGRAITDGERRHNKGCNCKRSGCLKNYCECYEAKIPCTESCKCIGCKNLEEDLDIAPTIKKEVDVTSSSTVATMTSSLPSAASTAAQVRKVQSLKARLAPFSENGVFKPIDGVKQPFSFVTTEVVEATCQCLLAQAEEAERKSLSEVENEAMVIEEFGRCLKQIIEIAKKTGSGGSGGGGGCSFDS